MVSVSNAELSYRDEKCTNYSDSVTDYVVDKYSRADENV